MKAKCIGCLIILLLSWIQVRADFVDFPICTNDFRQINPATNGIVVVWEDNRNDSGDIYGYNVLTSTEFPICIADRRQYAPVISGTIVVWHDNRNGNDDIYCYNLSVGTEFPGSREIPVCVNQATQFGAAIGNNIITWTDHRNGNWDIYGYDILTDTELPICTNSATQMGSATNGNVVVWYDDRNGNWDIYGYNVLTDTEFPICTDVSMQVGTAISDNFVVWRDSRYGNYDIYGYDLSTDTDFPICVGGSADWYIPVISGSIVVWTDKHNRNVDIYGYDLSTGAEFPICTKKANQCAPAIGSNLVVWEDMRNSHNHDGNCDIYGVIIPATIFRRGQGISPLIRNRKKDETAGWKTYRNEEYGYEFQYPEELDTQYIHVHSLDWPPEVSIAPIDSDFVCEEIEGKFPSGYGSQTEVTINGTIYCVLKTSSPTAGSSYGEFKYITNKDDKQLTFEFALRYIHCGVLYEIDNKMKECEKEQRKFDVDKLVDQILSTFKFIE